MPQKPLPAKYPSIFFVRLPDDGVECTVAVDNGDNEGGKKPCGHKFPRHNASNEAAHLRSAHRITVDSKDSKDKLAAVDGQRQLTLNTAGFTPKEKQAIAFAEAYMPFCVAELPMCRSQFGFAALDADTVANATRSAAVKARAGLLAQHANKTGTLMIDCGTVFEHYLAVGVAFAGVDAPALLDLVPIDSLGGASGANMRNVVLDVAAHLAKNGVKIVAVACDNASANTAAMKGLPEYVHQRCLAHSINLLAGDIFGASPLARQVFEWADGARTATNNIPHHVATRWNSRLPVVAAARDINIPPSGHVTADSVNQFVHLFGQLKTATDIVQRNGATAVEGIKAVVMLLNLEGRYQSTFNVALASVLPNRITTNFLMDHLLLVAYFSPATLQTEVPQNVHAQVRAMMSKECWTALTKRLGVGDEVRALPDEYLAFRVYPFTGIVAVTADAYRAAWTLRKATLPRLATLVLALLDVTPTEGAIERFFSQLKRLVPPNRSRLRHENATAQLLLNTLVRGPAAVIASPVQCAVLPANTAAIANNENAPDEDDDDDDGAVLVVDAGGDAAQVAATANGLARVELTRAECHAYIDKWHSTGRRAREDVGDEECGNCGRPFTNHTNDYRTKCTSCNRWVAHVCEGIADDMNEYMLSLPRWSCSNCMRRAAAAAPSTNRLDR